MTLFVSSRAPVSGTGGGGIFSPGVFKLSYACRARFLKKLVHFVDDFPQSLIGKRFSERPVFVRLAGNSLSTKLSFVVLLACAANETRSKWRTQADCFSPKPTRADNDRINKSRPAQKLSLAREISGYAKSANIVSSLRAAAPFTFVFTAQSGQLATRCTRPFFLYFYTRALCSDQYEPERRQPNPHKFFLTSRLYLWRATFLFGQHENRSAPHCHQWNYVNKTTLVMPSASNHLYRRRAPRRFSLLRISST